MASPLERVGSFQLSSRCTFVQPFPRWLLFLKTDTGTLRFCFIYWTCQRNSFTFQAESDLEH
jgi:hypothetical protein